MNELELIGKDIYQVIGSSIFTYKITGVSLDTINARWDKGGDIVYYCGIKKFYKSDIYFNKEEAVNECENYIEHHNNKLKNELQKDIEKLNKSNYEE